ncbi:MAG TPA: VIT domain-containing protein [Planctomycetaceae bacterium]|nr:VIT domain-containing protein [Planctomycetaceae bacterium]
MNAYAARFLRLPTVVIAGLLILAGAAAHTARACFMRSPLPVQVWLDHIDVQIRDQVATKIYNCTFKNPNPQAIVGGTCFMELEPGAQVDNMSVLVDGKEMPAEILDVEKAREVFQDIVKNGGSPALLEYYGNQLIQTQVPRVAPNGTVTVKLTYTTVVKSRGGLVRMQMLNTNPKALMQPLASASVTVSITSREPIKNVYSPTHELKFVEKEGCDVAVEWKQENYLPKHPFVLYYQTADEPVAASVVAHRELDEDGAFLLMLSPTVGTGEGQVTEEQILPKDVVFCVDTSGSMLQDGKMEQARAALRHCVESLRPDDRFNIVDFSTAARNFHESGLAAFNDETKAKALRYVEKLHARGGTAILEALELSLKHLATASKGDYAGSPADGRMQMIVFATDGLPTIGEREPEQILKSIAAKNKQDVRIFVFGEGFAVNTKLLDFLALDHRGEADYILPEENISEKIGRFFDRVGSPIMTDLELSFEGLEVKDVYPKSIPDVFKGEQVIVYGRYTGHGTKTVKLTGTVAGKRQTFEYQLEFPEYSEDDKHAFVPRLWAGRKVDFLLSELRKAGSDNMNQELIDEVTFLAKRYGIITPYTSFLVADDISGPATPGGLAGGPMPTDSFARGAVRERLAQSEAANEPAADARDRALGVQLAREAAGARRSYAKGDAAALYEQAEGELRRAGRDGSALEAMHYIGSRTFFKRGADWYESTYDPELHKDVKTIEVGSDEYFRLLDQDERIAKYLALENVVVRVKDRWYRFAPRRS